MRVLFCSMVLLLAGCASPQHSEEALVPAREAFQQVKSDPQVLQYAAKDVLRAGESLARAERLAGYWGSAGDVQHFAYLSQAYSAIAREHTQQALNRQRLQRLQVSASDCSCPCARHACSASSSIVSGLRIRCLACRRKVVSAAWY